MTPSCPVIDHLACKLPGELEPRIYDVYAPILALAAGQLFPQTAVSIGNRDAPWHLAAWSFRELSSGGRLNIRLYNSRGFAISDQILRAGNVAGGQTCAVPMNPSLVWPINSSIQFDVQNDGAGAGSWALFFYGFKIYDRGKAPC